MDEVERIKQAYGKRRGDSVTYSPFNPGQLFMTQQLERSIIGSLRNHGLNSLAEKKILDVGCGTAWSLRLFVNWGARPEHLSGFDLMQDAIDVARRINPNIEFRCGNAEALPFEKESFDIIIQFTVFTSILNDDMKQNIARGMLKVLKPDGLILWYDYFVSKPMNRDVQGVGKREIIRLFPNCTYDFGKVTLAPPIARAVAPYSFLICYLLEKIPWLRTHYLVVIRKRS